jgi:hypothetical protein
VKLLTLFIFLFLLFGIYSNFQLISNSNGLKVIKDSLSIEDTPDSSTSPNPQNMENLASTLPDAKDMKEMYDQLYGLKIEWQSDEVCMWVPYTGTECNTLLRPTFSQENLKGSTSGGNGNSDPKNNDLSKIFEPDSKCDPTDKECGSKSIESCNPKKDPNCFHSDKVACLVADWAPEMGCESAPGVLGYVCSIGSAVSQTYLCETSKKERGSNEYDTKKAIENRIICNISAALSASGCASILAKFPKVPTPATVGAYLAGWAFCVGIGKTIDKLICTK